MSDPLASPAANAKPAAETISPRRRLSPKKLLHSKWTAVVPHNKEKHFIVTQVIMPDEVGAAIEWIELEAVHSRRSQRMHWRDLTTCERWVQGWK